MSKKRITCYLHSSKESMFDKADELGLSDKAAEEFCYALYEVGFDLEVDTDTGKYTILAIKEGKDWQKVSPAK